MQYSQYEESIQFESICIIKFCAVLCRDKGSSQLPRCSTATFDRVDDDLVLLLELACCTCARGDLWSWSSVRAGREIELCSCAVVAVVASKSGSISSSWYPAKPSPVKPWVTAGSKRVAHIEKALHFVQVKHCTFEQNKSKQDRFDNRRVREVWC